MRGPEFCMELRPIMTSRRRVPGSEDFNLGWDCDPVADKSKPFRRQIWHPTGSIDFNDSILDTSDPPAHGRRHIPRPESCLEFTDEPVEARPLVTARRLFARPESKIEFSDDPDVQPHKNERPIMRWSGKDTQSSIVLSDEDPGPQKRATMKYSGRDTASSVIFDDYYYEEPSVNPRFKHAGRDTKSAIIFDDDDFGPQHRPLFKYAGRDTASSIVLGSEQPVYGIPLDNLNVGRSATSRYSRAPHVGNSIYQHIQAGSNRNSEQAVRFEDPGHLGTAQKAFQPNPQSVPFQTNVPTAPFATQAPPPRRTGTGRSCELSPYFQRSSLRPTAGGFISDDAVTDGGGPPGWSQAVSSTCVPPSRGRSPSPQRHMDQRQHKQQQQQQRQLQAQPREQQHHMQFREFQEHRSSLRHSYDSGRARNPMLGRAAGGGNVYF